MRTNKKLDVRVPLSSSSTEPWYSPSAASLSSTNPHGLIPVNESKKTSDKKGVRSRFFKLKSRNSLKYTEYTSSSQEKCVRQNHPQEEEEKHENCFENNLFPSTNRKEFSDTENTTVSSMRKINKFNLMIKSLMTSGKNREKTKLPTKNNKSDTGVEEISLISTDERTRENDHLNSETKTCDSLYKDNDFLSTANIIDMNSTVAKHLSQNTFSTDTTASSVTVHSTSSEPEEVQLGCHRTRSEVLDSQNNSMMQTFEDDVVKSNCNGRPSKKKDYFKSISAETSKEFSLVDSQKILDGGENRASPMIKRTPLPSGENGHDGSAAVTTKSAILSYSEVPGLKCHPIIKVKTPRGRAMDEICRRMPSRKFDKIDEDNKRSNERDKPDERYRRVQTLLSTRSALSRPFGRTSLPAHLAKQWQVEVSIRNFNETTWMWNYDIMVQKEEHGCLSILDDDVDDNKSGMIDKIVASSEGDSSDSGKMVDGPSSPPPLQQLLDENGISLSNSIAAASVTRTLEDFVWLEQAMREEYHGALVLPLLSLMVTNGGSSSDWTTTETIDKEVFQKGEWDPLVMSVKCLDEYLKDNARKTKMIKESGTQADCNNIEMESNGKVEEDNDTGQKKWPAHVNPKVLEDWLSDVINCVRGKGELIVKYEGINVIHSEAMETFLYSSKPLPKPITSRYMNTVSISTQLSPTMKFCFETNANAAKDEGKENSLTTTTTTMTKNTITQLCAFPQFLSNQFQCANSTDIYDELTSIDEDTRAPPLADINTVLQSDFILSKRSEVYAKLIPQWEWTNLILPWHDDSNDSSQSLQRSEVLMLQRLAIANQRECTLRAMYGLRILLDQEILISGAWKRFAISLSNLYSYEKDIENCKIGDLAKGKKILSSSNQRKSNKSVMDDSLRILTRQKMDRAVPSLKVLSVMLSAYFADFSSVDSSLQAYADALQKVRLLGKEDSDDDDVNRNGCESWQSHYLSSLSSYFNPKNSMKGNEERKIGVERSVTRSLTRDEEAFQKQVLSLEPTIKSSLLQLCESTDIRASRMLWKFFKMEAGQAALLRGAAVKLRTVIDSNSNSKSDISNDTVFIDKMGTQSTETTIGTRSTETTMDKSEEDENELELVRKMLDLGLQSKRMEDGKRMEGVKLETEGNTNDDGEDTISDPMLAALIDKALDFSRERPGRWDAELALVIMEAVGVENAKVLLEETTRDLRQARKLALGLRENVERCAEAIELLKEVAIGSSGQRSRPMETHYITKLKERFMTELSIVFRTTFNGLEDRTDEAWRNGALSKMDKDGKAMWLQTENTDGEKRVDVQIGRCGEAALRYQRTREKETRLLLNNLSRILENYEYRIESIENFVYMHCVGIQLEKHFSKQRMEVLAAWDRKTDIKTAINIATKKRLTSIVRELQVKMADVENVSHTSVKEAKERHLSSKILKGELEALSFRRFHLLKKDAVKQVVELIKLWANYEDSTADTEAKALADTIGEIEQHVSFHKDIIKADGGAHLFALIGSLVNSGHASAPAETAPTGATSSSSAAPKAIKSRRKRGKKNRRAKK